MRGSEGVVAPGFDPEGDLAEVEGGVDVEDAALGEIVTVVLTGERGMTEVSNKHWDNLPCFSIIIFIFVKYLTIPNLMGRPSITSMVRPFFSGYRGGL